MAMTNLLVEYDREIPTVSLIRETLNGITCSNTALRFKKVSRIDFGDINWADVVLSVRGNSVASRDLAHVAKSLGKFYILYSDDDLYDLPKNYVIHPKRKANFLAILQYADVILANNQLLAEKMCQLGKCNRSVLIDTIVNADEFIEPPSCTPDEKISFVYAAGVDHEIFFEDCVVPALLQLSHTTKNAMSITFIGVHPKIPETCHIETEFLPFLPLEDYRELMKSSRFAVGMAPLAHGGFAQYKYANKYLEYTMMGIAGLYSNCMPYTQVVRHKANGILCDDTPESWCNAIEEVINNKELVRRCVNRAQADVRERCNKQEVCKKLVQFIPELLSYSGSEKAPKRGQWIVSRFKQAFFRLVEIPYLAWKYFRKRGVKGLLRKVSLHFLLRS